MSETEHDPRCEKLSAYLDGELPSEIRERVRRHLSDCAECRHLHNDFVALLRCCAEHARDLAVPGDVHAAVVHMLRAASAGNE
jgi:anti-sigma factor RsiW